MQDHNEEPLNAQVFTQLTPAARDRFKQLARRNHLSPSVQLRVVIMEWIEKQP